MNLGLFGKRVWITGGSSGLGYAAAKTFVTEGAHLTLSARPGEKLERAAKELGAQALPLDLGDARAVREAALGQREAGVDIVVMSGGGPPPSTLEDLDDKGFDDAYALLLKSAFVLLNELAPGLAREGVVCFLTSSGVKEPIPGLLTSNVMRAGVTALMKTAANELAPRGVRVFAVAPGRIATERVHALDRGRAERQNLPVEEVRERSLAEIPMGRYGEPEEFGRMVAFLCSPAASYLSGVTVSVDGSKAKGVLS